ncbi:TIGR01777 family protein [Geodermatophilus sabuli]|uniref:TIGR01777 family protein n=1 Tax=Geodermatophilus sabuli TaxID=1564158 RepID=A0A7K3W6Y0_9ACTN|nr:TIGR01777 family oxidoreductase [Geodermatophilus sabuli]NEK60331.1 TIGR01777 family protein [Geodermatophilus sabuli]NEK60582.1 TIGR01777 family protein [Geodermatophilus sabuli]
MRIAVTGSSGLIGSRLVPALRADGHDVLRLVRRTPRTADEHRWDPQHRRIDPALLRDVDAVVNLAGTPIRPRPWTAAYKDRLRTSRLDSTLTVSQALADAAAEDPGRPRVLLSASGVGFYGDTGDRPVEEDAAPGSDFLARLCVEWEGATAAAADAGVRVAQLRTGLVVGRGAPLMQILGLVFRLGLGGRMGPGRQYWPWISLDDEVGAIRFLLTADVSGPVNLTGPAPVTNAEFTRRLGQVVHRPAVLPVPAFALSLALGEFGRTGVLAGQRALPARLGAAGYEWTHPELESALQAALVRG